MSDDLKRHLAPITRSAWAAIEDEARDTLKVYLAARKLADFQGPLGWKTSSISDGRVGAVHKAPVEGVQARVRQVRPLVELRAPFILQREELDTIERGNPAPDLEPVSEAARRIASAEDRIAFDGLSDAGIVGICESREHNPIVLGRAASDWTDAVARAAETLRQQGVSGPYAAAFGPEVYTGLTTTTFGGHTAMDIVQKVLNGGPVIWAPTLGRDAVVLSRRGGDFELVVGRDISIGYLHHDAETVTLYLEESLSFRLLGPEAAVTLRRGD